jgi:hypothetical protein
MTSSGRHQEIQPRVGRARRDFQDLGVNDPVDDERVGVDPLLQLRQGHVVRQHRAPESWLDAAHEQKYLILQTLLDPLLVAGHVLAGGGIIVSEPEQYDEHAVPLRVESWRM